MSGFTIFTLAMYSFVTAALVLYLGLSPSLSESRWKWGLLAPVAAVLLALPWMEGFKLSLFGIVFIEIYWVAILLFIRLLSYLLSWSRWRWVLLAVGAAGAARGGSTAAALGRGGVDFLAFHTSLQGCGGEGL